MGMFGGAITGQIGRFTFGEYRIFSSLSFLFTICILLLLLRTFKDKGLGRNGGIFGNIFCHGTGVGTYLRGSFIINGGPLYIMRFIRGHYRLSGGVNCSYQVMYFNNNSGLIHRQEGITSGLHFLKQVRGVRLFVNEYTGHCTTTLYFFGSETCSYIHMLRVVGKILTYFLDHRVGIGVGVQVQFTRVGRGSYDICQSFVRGNNGDCYLS